MRKILEQNLRTQPLSEHASNLLRRLKGLGQEQTTTIRTQRRIGIFGWSFIICVIVPTLIAGMYLAFVASRLYVSEARFAVRTAVDFNSNSALGTTALSFISTLSSTSATIQDAFIVSDYIKSRTIIEDLGGKDVVHAIYSRSDIDWLSRLGDSLPIEKIWKYWKRKVSIIIDTPTGIITLETYAFKPEDAKRLAELIVERSELLVNQISERSRNDALRRAEAEVELAQQRLTRAREAMLTFRNKFSLLDPRLSTSTIGATIQQLLRDKSKLESDAASVRGSMSSESPTLQILNARIANIDSQIADLRGQLTSQTQNSALSEQIAGYEERQLQVQFSEKIYAIAEATYVKAREEQAKQQLYLVTIVRPSLPEEDMYPRRVIDTSLVFAVCLILWSMVSLVVATIRDHME
jgi:capsular polysaccharide transport system permease protein